MAAFAESSGTRSFSTALFAKSGPLVTCHLTAIANGSALLCLNLDPAAEGRCICTFKIAVAVRYIYISTSTEGNTVFAADRSR